MLINTYTTDMTTTFLGCEESHRVEVDYIYWPSMAARYDAYGADIEPEFVDSIEVRAARLYMGNVVLDITGLINEEHEQYILDQVRP